MKWLEFKHDYRGFGDLVLRSDEHMIDSYHCRSGSISRNGTLKNAIESGDWFLADLSVDTDEPGMSAISGMSGWKIRLWRIDESGQLVFTHYLIHPDGGKPGSLGCIVIQGSNALSFRHELDNAVREQGRVAVKVGVKDGQIS
jgi:hypothetical protein